MTPHHPILLLLMLLIPLALYLRYARRRKLTVRFSDGRTLARLPPSWAVRMAWILPAAYGLGLMFLILALSRPQKGMEESRVHTESVDIVLLVDVSTSMRAEDFSTATKRMNRLDAAKQVIDKFIQSRPDDRIGMVAFSAMPYTIAPLTLDHAWLLLQMERLETGMIEDGTAIGDAIASAVNRLRDSKSASKIVILLTDGMNHRGKLTPDNAAQAAKALGIKIYTVGAGTEGFAPYPVDSPFGGVQYIRQRVEIDEAGLKRIADATGAQYFRATDLKSLNKIYEEIDRMEKTEVEVEQFTRFEESFQPFLIIGLLLLGLEKLLSLTRMGRLP
ncbi:MAG: VWA domain-containing protein [Lentisphaerota bacterium]